MHVSVNSVITSLCNGKVVTKNSDDVKEAVHDYVVMLRSGVLGTDVRPLIADRFVSPQASPLHVIRTSFLHDGQHTSTKATDFELCRH